MKEFHILTINPGSTSSKIGVFKDEECLFEINVSHSPKQLEKYANIWEQYDFRKKEIIAALVKHNFSLKKLNAVVGRGGLIKPIPSGTYNIDQQMIEDARIGYQGQHASNLGCVIAYSIGWEYEIPSFIVDPPAVNDFEPIAKISGHKNFERTSLLHALNIFATARNYAQSINKKIEDLNLVVAHLGGGISVAAVKKGKAINANNGLFEGPFSPERSGSLPLAQFMATCKSGKYTDFELKKMLVGKGGLVSYFNTNDARDVENMINAGSERYRLVYQALAYQVAEEIGRRATNLKGKVDAVILTGGIAHSKMLTSWIKERTEFISDVHILAGEAELEALAKGGLRVLKGEERAKNYTHKIKKVGILYWDNLEIYVSAINTIEEKFKNADYIFRKEENNMTISYVNCKREEENVVKAIEKFRHEKYDLIIAIGSPISVRLGQYLKNDKIPVIFSGIYNPAVIADFDHEKNMNYYAVCYALDIKEQFENSILKIEEKIDKIGVIYKRGEIQAEIQYDNVVEYCKTQNIKAVSYEVQSADDFEKAKKYFLQKNVKWVYIGTSTTIASTAYEKLKVINDNFLTLCMLEDTVYRGALMAYAIPWKEISNETANLALDIFDNQKIKLRTHKPDSRLLIVNSETSKTHKFDKKISKFKDVKMI